MLIQDRVFFSGWAAKSTPPWLESCAVVDGNSFEYCHSHAVPKIHVRACVSVSVYVFVPMSLCVHCVCACVALCVHLSLCLSLYLCLYIFMCVCVFFKV